MDNAEALLKKVVDLYWQSYEADKSYDKSTEAKANAVGLAVEFSDLMKNLREKMGKPSAGMTLGEARRLLTHAGRKTTDKEVEKFVERFEGGDPVMPVSFFCDFLKQWAHLSSVPAIEADDETNERRRKLGEQAQYVFTQIQKSNLLARTIYGGEPARTTPCPYHKGKWSGCRLAEDTECKGACLSDMNVTGWLPEGNEYIDRDTYLINAGWVSNRHVVEQWQDPLNKESWVNVVEAMRIQMARDVEAGKK